MGCEARGQCWLRGPLEEGLEHAAGLCLAARRQAGVRRRSKGDRQTPTVRWENAAMDMGGPGHVVWFVE